MSPFWQELKRRNIFKVGVAYLVMAWFILQLGSIVAPALNLPVWTLSFVIFILVIGFPLVLFFAWAFEVTPEGLKRTKEVGIEESVTIATGQKLNVIIIVILGLVIVALLVDKFLVSPNRSASQEQQIATADEAIKASFDSIAVLPFDNMSDDAQQEYFSDGISEELLNLLAKNQALRVAARTSSFAFKGQNQDIKKIGRELDVDTVLEGSVRKSGAKIRITAQLIETDTGYHLWSDTYDRELTDVFAIQDEIGAAIVAALNVHLTGGADDDPAKSQVTNLDAYNAFLKGRHEIETREKAAIYKALAHFDAAIAYDPVYAPAYSGKADAYLLLSDDSYGDIPMEQAGNLARPAIERALELDPNLAEAYASQGLLHQLTDEDEASVASLTRAIELSPNLARAYVWRGNAHQSLGQKNKRIKDMEMAVKLDPFSLPGLSNLHSDYLHVGRSEEAAEVRERLKSIAGEEAYHYRIAEIARAFNQNEFALVYTEAKELKEAFDLPFVPQIGWSAFQMKNKEEALAHINFPIGRFFIHFLTGDTEAAANEQTKISENPELVDYQVDVITSILLLFAKGDDESLQEAAKLSLTLDENPGGILFGVFPNDVNAPPIIALRRMVGDVEGANRLIEGLRESVQDLKARGYGQEIDNLEIALLIFDGDLDGAMTKLKAGAAEGRINWTDEFFPVFDPLKDREEFKAIFADMDANINAERAKLGWDPVE